MSSDLLGQYLYLVWKETAKIVFQSDYQFTTALHENLVSLCLCRWLVLSVFFILPK